MTKNDHKPTLGHKYFSLIPIILFTTSCLYGGRNITSTAPVQPAEQGQTQNKEATTVFLPMVTNTPSRTTDCLASRLGSMLFTETTSGETTIPYLQSLNLEGYSGFIGTPTYEPGAEYFDEFAGWDRIFICNSHDCLKTRAGRAETEGIDYDYLSYGPERLGGVPDEEKNNLPWATQTAKEIADQWDKPLMISYSTRQLHLEAEERGYDWNDPSEVVALLAPYGDVWMIQAADEYWRLDDGTIRPILSQRVYPPGVEFRAEVERWVGWIRSANPDIKIWIQLGLQRIGVEGENNPSADLLLAYRDSIVDLVDGIYITPIYGSVEQFPSANQEMVEVFHQACSPKAALSTTQTPKPSAQSTSLPNNGNISMVEEGWSDDLEIPCPPSGDCLTIIPGYYYRIYENTRYPCGAEGYHQFMVLDHAITASEPKNLFAKFPGGGVGFWYTDENNQRVYYPNDLAAGLLNAAYFRNMFFRTSLSEEYGGGVTKKFRENQDFRIVVTSYCSHDLYHGKGEYNEIDGYARWGYQASMEAVDYVQQQFNTKQIIAYGGSAGAAGAFFVGKDQENVAAIIMDSQAADLSAISDACYDGISVFGNSYPCFCPEGGSSCMEILAQRIGFEFSVDEPYRLVESGFDKPVYFVWNERDASIHANLQFDRLHEAILQHNPGSNSIANMVCITDPRTPPGPTCNLHVPSGYDIPETETLIEEIYSWAMSNINGGLNYQVNLPLIAH